MSASSAILLFKTLRARLLAAIALVQLAVLGAVMLALMPSWSALVVQASQSRVAEVSTMLSAALGQPLASHNEAAIGTTLAHLRAPEGIDYLVLFDNDGRVVAARGWDAGKPLPPIDDLNGLRSARALPPLIHVATSVSFLSRTYGTLRFGLSTDSERLLVSRVIWRSQQLLLWGMLSSSLLLCVAVLWITRRLPVLRHAAAKPPAALHEALAALTGEDEIGAIAASLIEINQARLTAASALMTSEERFHVIAEHTANVELWLGSAGELLWISASVRAILGYTPEECLRMRDFPTPLATIDERANLTALFKEMHRGTRGQGHEFRLSRRNGKTFWAAMSWQPVYSPTGEALGIRASIHDNGPFNEDRLALKRAVHELQQSQALNQTYVTRGEAERTQLSALLTAMRFGVLYIDRDHLVVFNNPAFKMLWLIDDAVPIIGRALDSVLQCALNRPLGFEVPLLGTHAEHDYDSQSLPATTTMNDGRILTQRYHEVRDIQGQVCGHMLIYEDVTHEHFLNEKMIFLAERDTLTGLYNRHAFITRLRRLLVDAERGQQMLAALYFDLDEFKYVNDTFGHGAGDAMLKLVAQEIGSQVRRDEFFARMGGDEFGILIPDCNESEVANLANRLVAALGKIPFVVDGHALRLSSSLGVALYPQHGETAEDLIAHADSAMYQAKAAGKATWRSYQPERDASREMVNRLTWNDRIQHALEVDGFVMYFQGIYDVHTLEVVHLEALVRMKDVNQPGQIIPPNQFIPHAERSGKILDIDRWVLRQCIGMLGANAEMPPLAVNISGRSFDEISLPDYIGELLREYAVEPARLMVELTETAAVSDMRDAQRFIEALHSTGCTVCLDDFGAGFSSFAYLKHLKARVLKIDGLFIRDLTRDLDSQVFVKGMATIARDMDKLTVAEFVESQEILTMLVEFGVDMVQGYFLDKPQPDHPALRGIGVKRE